MNILCNVLILGGLPILVFLGGFLLLNWLGRSKTAANEKPLNERWGYNLQDVSKYWEGLDKAEILSIEFKLLIYDLFFPVCYGGALLISMRSASIQLGWPPYWILAVLFVLIAVLADWAENVSLLNLLKNYMHGGSEALNPGLVKIASFTTKSKFIFIILSAGVLLYLIIMVCLNSTRA